MRKKSRGFRAMLEILRTSRGNVASLGPAGALGPVYTPYRVWLAELDSAIALAEREIDRR